MQQNKENHSIKIVYFLPCKPGSIYINITESCLNNCLFCIRRNGFDFYGSSLKLNNGEPQEYDIVLQIKDIICKYPIQEVVICGMGEPMLRYKTVLEVCKYIKSNFPKINTRIDTAGLYWNKNKNLDFLNYTDILNISLNAESSELYNELCQPKIPNAYNILLEFLDALKREEKSRKITKSHFPKIRLSVVNTSEEKYIPESGRKNYKKGAFPVPDFEKCKEITNSYGWEFQIKILFRDSQDEYWKKDKNFRKDCANGVSPEYCKDKECTYRH